MVTSKHSTRLIELFLFVDLGITSYNTDAVIDFGRTFATVYHETNAKDANYQ